MRQKSLFDQNHITNKSQFSPLLRGEKEFGGSLLINKRKSKRPVATQDPIHLVLKGDIPTAGSLVWNAHVVTKVVEKFAQKFKVKIYEKAIVFDHIHFVVKVETRESYANFVRAVAGSLARRLKIKWLFRPYTRLLKWGRSFRNAVEYTIQNRLEANGVVPYTPRKKRKVKVRSG